MENKKLNIDLVTPPNDLNSKKPKDKVKPFFIKGIIFTVLFVLALIASILIVVLKYINKDNILSIVIFMFALAFTVFFFAYGLRNFVYGIKIKKLHKSKSKKPSSDSHFE